MQRSAEEQHHPLLAILAAWWEAGAATGPRWNKVMDELLQNPWKTNEQTSWNLILSMDSQENPMENHMETCGKPDGKPDLFKGQPQENRLNSIDTFHKML